MLSDPKKAQKLPDFKRLKMKFQQLRNFDSDYRRQSELKHKSSNIQHPQDPLIITKKQIKQQSKFKSIPDKQHHQIHDVTYSQSQIPRQVAKLKPYLTIKAVTLTTDQLEELAKKKISQQNYQMMAELMMYENLRLCQIGDKSYDANQQAMIERQEREKQGWVFEVVHRSVTNSKDDINSKPFMCGYALMTNKIQIFESLTFQKKLISIIPSQIIMVRYQQQSNYQIITIQQQNIKVQCGFQNSKKFQIFDRMLFLQKNMSRSTSNRLFQSQLINNLYQEYQKL